LKNLFKLLTTGLLAVIFSMVLGVGSAKALVMESVPIWIIDGNDLNTTVNIGILDGLSGFDLGYLDNTGSFVVLLPSSNIPQYAAHTWNGGDVVDFAIRNISDNSIYSLGTDASGNNYCTLDFSGVIAANNSSNPILSSDYWNTVNMHWGIPTAVAGLTNTSFDVAMAMGNDGDGMAPVPEPASIALLGMGILGLVGLKRKA